AHDPGGAVQARLDATTAFPVRERVARRADGGLPVGNDVLVVQTHDRHGGLVVVAEELQLGLARHITVAGDDRAAFSHAMPSSDANKPTAVSPSLYPVANRVSRCCPPTVYWRFVNRQNPQKDPLGSV